MSNNNICSSSGQAGCACAGFALKVYSPEMHEEEHHRHEHEGHDHHHDEAGHGHHGCCCHHEHEAPQPVDSSVAALASDTTAVYLIKNMDCPMEEALIRKRLA